MGKSLFAAFTHFPVCGIPQCRSLFSLSTPLFPKWSQATKVMSQDVELEKDVQSDGEPEQVTLHTSESWTLLSTQLEGETTRCECGGVAQHDGSTDQ